MCFDLDELLLLLEYKTIDLFSQYNFSGLSMFPNICSPMTKFCNHIPWLDALKHAINFTSIVEVATSVCLTLFHEMAPPANEKMQPEVDF